MKLIKPLTLVILMLQLFGCGQKGVLYSSTQSLESENNRQEVKSKKNDSNDETER